MGCVCVCTSISSFRERGNLFILYVCVGLYLWVCMYVYIYV